MTTTTTTTDTAPAALTERVQPWAELVGDARRHLDQIGRPTRLLQALGVALDAIDEDSSLDERDAVMSLYRVAIDDLNGMIPASYYQWHQYGRYDDCCGHRHATVHEAGLCARANSLLQSDDRIVLSPTLTAGIDEPVTAGEQAVFSGLAWH